MASFFGPRHTSEYAISAHCHAGNAASKLQEDITFQPHLRASESTELARYKLDFYYDRPAQQMRAFYFTLVFLLSSSSSLLGEASPSIGNTLWRVSTMFTRPATTPSEVNGFG